MKIAFGFLLDQPFFKDRHGYKTPCYEPGVFYGYIQTEIYLEDKPQSETSFTENDQRFQDFLNNKTIETDVLVATKGVANHKMLNDSRGVLLDYQGSTYKIEIELISFEPDEFQRKQHPDYKEMGLARCKMRLLDQISEMKVPRGKLSYLPKKSAQWMGIAKYCLNHPGEYYYSDRQKFFTPTPRNLSELLMVYDADRGFDSNIPASEVVVVDPLFYSDHSNPSTAELARKIISGNF